MALFDMVFEGGGAKGSAFVGALEVLGAKGHKHRRLIGTSAGAITATLVAAGYTPQELRQAVTERLANGKPRFSEFMDPPTERDFSEEQRKNSQTFQLLQQVNLPGPLDDKLHQIILAGLLSIPHYRKIFSFVECGGFFAGNKFLEWLREKLAAKGIPANTTLQAFAQRKKADLSLVVSDTSEVEMLVLNHRTAPACPVEWAVRMSMSIPFVWREVVWQKEWGKYRGQDKAGKLIVDGGVLSNFPIRLIAEKNALIEEIMGPTDPQGAGNLGLLIDEDLPVPGAANKEQPPELKDQLRTVQRVSRLVDTMSKANDKAAIQTHVEDICRIPAKGYGTTEFDMEKTRLDALVEGGRKAMTAFLAAKGL